MMEGGLKVLVVDDDDSIRMLVSVILRGQGYEVKTAYNGFEALDIFTDWTPDLVLLDVMMPEMDGFETLKRMRQVESSMGTPVIMLTAKSDIKDKEVGFISGADDYLVKPFNNTELLLRISAQLRRDRISAERERYRPRHAVSVPIVLNRQRSGIFNRGYRFTKRLFDFVVSLVSLPFAVPLMMLVGAAVWIDSPGAPVIFTQNRTGANGKRFKMYKFRTMLPNAEELKQKYLHMNELTWPDFKITDDPRVTRVGKILRKTSLDELPQLFNILRGDMSFVGPRPTSFASETYDLWHTERLEVRPGLTGLWQINGRGDIDFDERVEMDIEYIERQSWSLDLAILFRTFSAVITGKGAH